MTIKKTAFALLLGSALSLTGHQAVQADSVERGPEYEAAAKLVDEVIAKPGFTRQICSTRALGNRVLFLPYQFYRGEDKITPKNYQLLRGQRDAVLQVVIDRLPDVMDAVIADWEARSAEGGFRHPYGLISYEHSHYLAILIDLNGVEALPTLLALLGSMQGDSYKLQRGDTLSTITGILRQERYQPLLDSDMEQAYRERAFHGVNDRLTPESIEDSSKRYFQFDPITGRACSYTHMTARLEIEVTPELEAQIVGWARDFLSTVPAERRLGAKGMNAWPVVR